MLILTFEEFNNEFNIDNNAMSDIRIKDIGKDISLTPIEILMRDQTPDSIGDPNFNIIVNLHPTEGTHWVLVIRREDQRSGYTDGPVYYFDSFGAETPPLFLEEYVDLGSNERIQQYDPTNSVSVNINDDLYSWLNDDDIITEAAFPDNFRCIISGPSECGKKFLLKKLILASIYLISYTSLDLLVISTMV